MPDLKTLIHPNTLNTYHLNDQKTVRKMSPVSALNSSRLDVMARYIYAKSKIAGKGTEWGRYCYYDLIRAWTQDFKLPPPYEPGRYSMQDYWDQFNALIDSVSSKGYDPSTSIIPTCQNTLVDGAHRLAASLALRIENVSTIELEGEKQVQDYETMRRIGLDNDVLLNMVYEFVKLKNKTRLAVLFPIAQNMQKEFLENFKSTNHIDYCENIPLTFKGLQNLQNFFYGQHEWWNEWHSYDFAKKRAHKLNKNITILFFQEKEAHTTRLTKEKIRSFHPADTHVLHTTDTHEETIIAAQILLNMNGRDLLNSHIKSETRKFDTYFEIFKRLVDTQKLNQEVALDTGSVMALYGLRDIQDIDYISDGTLISSIDPMISKHEEGYDLIKIKVNDILYDPRKHILYKDIKFVSLDLVCTLKKARGSVKDLNDVLMVENLKNKHLFDPSIAIARLVLKAKYKAIMTYYSSYNNLVRMLKKNIAPRQFKELQKWYRKSKRIKSTISSHIQKLFSNKNHIYYLLWKLANGDESYRLNYNLTEKSLVFDVGGYEGEWSQQIYSRYNPSICIFEPVKKFTQICEIKFKDKPKVKVLNFGLGKKTEQISISVAEDASSTYKVGIQTEEVYIHDIVVFMDENNIDNVDLIKLNIEGAEFDVLEKLIETGKIKQFKHLQIQFHDFVGSAKKRRKTIVSNLKTTHSRSWNYPFVWEGWSLKDE